MAQWLGSPLVKLSGCEAEASILREASTVAREENPGIPGLFPVLSALSIRVGSVLSIEYCISIEYHKSYLLKHLLQP